MSVLTDADKQYLYLARREVGGFHIATDWYFRGFIPLPYQYAYHHVPVANVTFLAGIAAGKTISSAASLCIDCISIPYFKALSTSVTAKQAELPFDFLTSWYESNPKLEHLIYDIKLRPWPIVYFQNFSEWEFRTAGADARFIRGHEYDRIVYDEAGLDGLGETAKVLRGRLRGRRPDGTIRMSRLDAITSPTDAQWLKERYYRGIKTHDTAQLDKYASLKIRTRDNTMLTEEQIGLMEAEYTPEMIAVEMDANFPDYGMSMFPTRHVTACTSQEIADNIYISMNPEEGAPKAGYGWEEHPRYGVVRYEMPYDPRGVYVMAGDPGLDDPPRRNASVVCVARTDVTPNVVVYFDWVFSRGTYKPFLSSYKYAINKYRPAFKALDTTSTQKGLQELGFSDAGIETQGINFQRDKEAALNSLSLMISNHEIAWAPVRGIQRQVGSYTRENDKKIAQDIVMGLAMLALGCRYAPEPGAGIQTWDKAVPKRRSGRRKKRRRRYA